MLQRVCLRISLLPTHLLTHIGSQINNTERAVALYKRAVNRARERKLRDSRPYVELGEYYIRAKQLDDAERMFREAIRVEPGNPNALFALGTFLGENKENADIEAWPLLYRASKLDSNKINHYFNLAIVSSRITTALNNNPELIIEPKGINFFDIAQQSYINVRVISVFFLFFFKHVLSNVSQPHTLIFEC